MGRLQGAAEMVLGQSTESPPAGLLPLAGTAAGAHTKRSEMLASEIVEEIVSKALQPGDMLSSEATMVDQYDLGASLREAVRLLEAQGLVTMKPGPGGGPVVGTVDPTTWAARHRSTSAWSAPPTASWPRPMEVTEPCSPSWSPSAAPEMAPSIRSWRSASPPVSRHGETRWACGGRHPSSTRRCTSPEATRSWRPSPVPGRHLPGTSAQPGRSGASPGAVSRLPPSIGGRHRRRTRRSRQAKTMLATSWRSSASRHPACSTDQWNGAEH